jgi:hypothetical protein
VQALQRGPAQMVGGVEAVGRLEVGQQCVVVIEGVVVVLRRLFLGGLDLVFGQFLF